MKQPRRFLLSLRPTLALLLCAAFVFLCAASPTHANERGDGMSLIRDAEIEAYLKSLASPVLRAAEIDPKSVSLVIVQNSDINAFVAGGMNIFFFTGLLQSADTPDQLQGVIAHETGHIAGGHLIRGQEAMKNASTQAIIGMLAGLAAGVASGNGQIAVGAISAAQNVAERSFMSFSRAQESSADAAAMRFLDDSNTSSQGLLEFMKKLAGQDLMPIDRQSQYVRTHPLSQDRVQNIANHVETKSKLAGKTLGEPYTTAHERMKSKLLGFLQPEAALLRYTDKDPRSTARYARAIALYRTNQLPRALALMDTLLKEEPNNPYYLELKAQMLFENGKIADSVTLYAKAVERAPESALIRVAYSHALLENKNVNQLDPAIQQLLEANRIEERNPETWRFLAAAWSRKLEVTKETQYQGLVSYALAEEALAQGHDKEAKRFAVRALKTLSKGSPYWLRTQDIKLSVDDDAKD